MAKRSRKNKVATPGFSTKITAPSAPSSTPGQAWLWALLLIAAAILAYSPVWWAGYVWDDDYHLTNNPCIVGPLGFKEIWTTRAGQFFPLVLTTFWLEHTCWGLTPLPYHLVNVFQHAVSGILLWRVLLGLRIPGAWLGAALWTLHPLQVESVAWISEMKNTQSGLFYLATILFFIQWLRDKDLAAQDKARWSYGLTLLFAALALASKSTTVVLPAVLALCAWWIEGRWQWRHLLRLTPIILMSIVSVAITLWPQDQAANFATHEVRSWPERFIIAGDAIWFYLGKLVWPYPLMTIYPRWQIDAGNWLSYLPLLIATVAFLFLWLKRNPWTRPWFFAAAYFLIVLSPFLTLIDQTFWRYSFVEDHLLYLASMGPLALAGAGITRLTDSFLSHTSPLRLALSTLLLLILGATTWTHAWAYESDDALWTDALAKNPQCWPAYNNLGLSLFKSGQVDAAIADYQAALAINPNYAEARYNLGLALMKEKRIDDAIVQLQKAVEIRPNYVDAHNNLGAALALTGHTEDAIAHYQRAMAIAPDFAEPHYNLGDLLFANKRTDEAIVEYKRAVEIQPNYSAAHYNLGNALLSLNRTDEAIAQYEDVLEIDPNYAEAHNNLGIAYFKKGAVDQAIAQFQEALCLNPGNISARNNLAKLQALKRP